VSSDLFRVVIQHSSLRTHLVAVLFAAHDHVHGGDPLPSPLHTLTMPPYSHAYYILLGRDNRRSGHHRTRHESTRERASAQGSFSTREHRSSRGGRWDLPERTKAKIAEVLNGGWAVRTRKNHASALGRYRAFCRESDVPNELILPAVEPVLCAWLASMHGQVSSSTARNDLAGLRAWHIRQNRPFPTSERVTKILESIEHHRPARSRLPPRPPVTIDMIRILVDHLFPSLSSFDLAVLACALVAFWAQLRMGEVLPTSRSTFSPDLFPTRASWGSSRKPTITLPWTKTTKSRGAVVRIPPQSSRTCAVSALSRYLRKHPAPATAPLFSYYGRDGQLVPLTKKAFIDCINAIWSGHNIPRITGHSFRIGGSTELLQRGVNPDVVKVSGRWSSDSFLRYWRKADEVLPMHLDNVVISSRRRAAPRG
jgi:hypothetical protein